ncbi:IclR family transcriptional regulator [Nocardia sp. NPDC050630]|uniref:IclR family transcriptional regulator n=1 Tax=Nocardia sp. NPDC050630 TaxID=3364321 RepID=UPI00378BCC69
MKNKPAYSIESVDHALWLAVMLQQEGPMRVAEVAERLGVARSTAHRLLAMLVYRDFAEQDDERRYVAGAVLRPADPGMPVARLREVALPVLRKLMNRCGETVHLMMLAGTEIRFIASAECDAVLRVGDREGRVLPAHLASGGQAMLAALTDAEIDRRYADTGVDVPVLRRELRKVRRNGFAINNQRTETGLTALGRALPGARLALSIAMPTARYDRLRIPEWVTDLAATATELAAELERMGVRI